MSAPRPPRLVAQVADSLTQSRQYRWDVTNREEEARVAVRAVAAWLHALHKDRRRGTVVRIIAGTVARVLFKEADR